MIDSVALLPAYLAAGTAVLVLVTDLVAPGRYRPVIAAGALGVAATGAASAWVGAGPTRSTFCSAGAGCSYIADPVTALVGVVFASLTLAVLALSMPLLRSSAVPAGEYVFLLACSLTGAVVLGGARDLVTVVVAVETLTLPLYILVGLRRSVTASASAAVSFFLVSVVSAAVALLGAALLYAATGAIHLAALRSALGSAPADRAPLVSVGAVLLLGGLAFKVAAVPLHAWAPSTYDGAPLPVAAYLSTASKLGGVTALVLVLTGALAPVAVTGPALAVLAALTMTVGNLIALRQRRMVRLLAWSSIAQSGYILAPLAAPDGRGASLGYAVFYVLLEVVAFAAIISLRGAGDGGEIADYRGVARRSPWVAIAFTLALTGLAGLPPGLAGLFAKVTVVRALINGGVTWLAVVVVLNAVIGLTYYLRVVTTLFAPAPAPAAVPAPAPPLAPALAPAFAPGPAPRPDAADLGDSRTNSGAQISKIHAISWTVAVGLAVMVALAVVAGFAPELVLRAAQATLVVR
jgi:NADH-quinone oxidoreductase subunit N